MTEQETMQGLRACWEYKDCSKCPFVLELNDCHSELAHEAYKTIERLRAENAALRERLDKAVELPVKVGDIVYCVDDEDGDYIVKPTVVTKKNIYLLCSRIKGNPSDAFLLQKAAEEWCKELKGEENE